MVIEYLTAILAFITAIYAYLTLRMAKASEASVEAMLSQSEAMLRPYITIAPFIRPHTTLLYLRITNTGKTGARNLRLTIDRDFFQYGSANEPKSNLKNMSAFSNSIDSLPPGAELIFGLGVGAGLFGESVNPNVSPIQFNITAAYEFGAHKVEEISRIDLRPYVGTESEHDPVVEELERIRRVLDKSR